MAGNPASVPQVPPAGTPPANNGGNNQQQQTPAPQQGTQQQQQQQPPAQNFIMNQEQFNARWGEKMGELEKALGIDSGALKNPDTIKNLIAAQKPKPLTGETLSGADLKLAKMEALMQAKVPSELIPLYLQHFNIAGKTREEIQASIQQLIDKKLLAVDALAQPGTQQQQGPPNAAQGAGNTGVPGTPGKKTWKKSEIRTALANPSAIDATVLAEINQAQQEGRVDYNS
jgi:hypothetical protein